MRIDNAAIKKLDLSSASKSVVGVPLDHFPLLTSDRCLDSSTADLTKWTSTIFEAGHFVQAETVTMPRRGFGPRPVTLMASTDRVMRSALLGALRAELPGPTRGQGKWPAFSNFGMPETESTDNYVVNIDIAAC